MALDVGANDKGHCCVVVGWARVFTGAASAEVFLEHHSLDLPFLISFPSIGLHDDDHWELFIFFVWFSSWCEHL
jgi:hypothetical protein